MYSPIVLLAASFNDDRASDLFHLRTMILGLALYNTIARMEASGNFTADQLASFYKFQLVADKEYINRLQSSHKNLPASIRSMTWM